MPLRELHNRTKQNDNNNKKTEKSRRSKIKKSDNQSNKTPIQKKPRICDQNHWQIARKLPTIQCNTSIDI